MFGIRVTTKNRIRNNRLPDKGSTCLFCRSKTSDLDIGASTTCCKITNNSASQAGLHAFCGKFTAFDRTRAQSTTGRPLASEAEARCFGLQERTYRNTVGCAAKNISPRPSPHCVIIYYIVPASAALPREAKGSTRSPAKSHFCSGNRHGRTTEVTPPCSLNVAVSGLASAAERAIIRVYCPGSTCQQLPCSLNEARPS